MQLGVLHLLGRQQEAENYVKSPQCPLGMDKEEGLAKAGDCGKGYWKQEDE